MREAPDQFLIGCMSTTYCVLLALAIHLETEGMKSGAAPQNPYVFSLGTNTPDNAKNNIVNVLGGQDGAVQGGGVLAGGQRGEHQDRLQQSSNEIIGLYSQQKESL